MLAQPGLASPQSGKARRRSRSPLSPDINAALPLLLIHLSFTSSRFPHRSPSAPLVLGRPCPLLFALGPRPTHTIPALIPNTPLSNLTFSRRSRFLMELDFICPLIAEVGNSIRPIYHSRHDHETFLPCLLLASQVSGGCFKVSRVERP